MQQEVFALRYQVYCLERGFLDPGRFADGLETDGHDARSIHFTARSVAAGRLAGSMRLVRADPHGRFPFQDWCAQLFDDVRLPAAGTAGEISRLVVHRDFRRRTGDSAEGVPESFTTGRHEGLLPGQAAPGERRSHSPDILLGLYREMYQYSLQAGVRWWYAAMERALVRVLARLHFDFQPIGVQTDYYGPVVPYLADLRAIEATLTVRRPELLAWFRGER